MTSLRLEAHSGIVGATILGVDVVGARGVPGEAEEDGAVRAVVIVLILDNGSNGVVDLLVVEGLLGLLSSSDDDGESRL